jgi:hypothetical protein
MLNYGLDKLIGEELEGRLQQGLAKLAQKHGSDIIEYA